ncbi:hypothetical protein MNBD_PLANCTO03-765 [hydrothermal vent metagenome]|uniref:DUF1425 domain-containing protein n=1 Tax=hydrothermal vent metagenome TaxID=652676 RepID=A0A3B1DRE0_9ZZZZ
MNTRYTIVLGALATGLAAATLTGCDTTARPFSGRLDLAQPYPKVSVAPNLYDFVAFTEPTVTPGTNETPLHVVTPCRSTQDGITRVQYQYEWFDAQDRPVGESGWKYTVIPARAQVFLEANALSTDAKDWRLTVRPAG